eukprot:732204-Amphidinium_carterae.1
MYVILRLPEHPNPPAHNEKVSGVFRQFRGVSGGHVGVHRWGSENLGRLFKASAITFTGVVQDNYGSVSLFGGILFNRQGFQSQATDVKQLKPSDLSHTYFLSLDRAAVAGGWGCAVEERKAHLALAAVAQRDFCIYTVTPPNRGSLPHSVLAAASPREFTLPTSPQALRTPEPLKTPTIPK